MPWTMTKPPFPDHATPAGLPADPSPKPVTADGYFLCRTRAAQENDMATAQLRYPEDRKRDENQAKAKRAEYLAGYLAAQAEVGPLKEASDLLLEYAHILGAG